MKKCFVIVLALALALSMTTMALAEGTVKIGVVGPLTGGAAVYGVAVKNGAQIAADEINALGGIQLELIAQDDQHDAEVAVNAYNALWDAGAQMILGTVTTTPCIAVSTEAYNDRMFMLTPSASSPAVTEGKDNIFQVCFTDPAQGTLAAQYIAEKQLGEKIAIIYNNADAYSTGIYQAFEAEAAAKGLEIVSVTTFTEDTTDFSVQVAACKDNGADVVFLPIYYTPASMILAQAKATDYAPLFFGVDGMDGILTIEGFDTSLAEGVMLLTPFAASATDEKTVNFVTKYNELYGETPNQFAADAYDGIYVLYELIQNAGITAETSAEDACEMLIAEIQKLEYVGTTGTMTWASSGEVVKVPIVVTIQDGVYVVNE